jgi:ubiquinone/menaquinone biosynthesis C-methylase UbiE
MFADVEEAFSRQSEIFDYYEKGNDILKWMRSVTHRHLLKYLKERDVILEINSGTGIDAIFLGKKGFRIHCTDISKGMINKLREKIISNNLNNIISYQLLSYTELEKSEIKQFDYIFSNFGGLNCAPDLNTLFSQFRKILKPGGKVTMVIIPPVCPWEIALLMKGQFKRATRRLREGEVKANVEGVNFPVYYYTASEVIKALGADFRIIDIQGLASISPPPYMDNFPKRHPMLYKRLTILDEKISHLFPFNRFADHIIITAEFSPKQ